MASSVLIIFQASARQKASRAMITKIKFDLFYEIRLIWRIEIFCEIFDLQYRLYQKTDENRKMQVLLAMRNEVYRGKNNSIFILNLFALQLICLIAMNRLGSFYLKISQVLLITVGDDWSFSATPILINFIAFMIMILIFVGVQVHRTWQYRTSAIKLLGIIIVNFKYVMLVPIACINVKPLIDPSVPILFKIFCSFNLLITFVLSAIELYTNWSNRFIEKDYCNRRENSIVCLFLQFGFAISTMLLGNLVGALFLIGVSIFRVYQVSITVEYDYIQKSTFFYSAFNIYMCFICLVGEGRLNFIDLTCKIVIGIVVSNYFSKNSCKFLINWYSNSKSLFNLNGEVASNSQLGQKQSEPDHEQQNKFQNSSIDTMIFSRIILSKIRFSKTGKDETNQWDLWWQKYLILLVSHLVACTSEKCQCKKSQINEDSENKIILDEIRKIIKILEQDKMADSRIMAIYLNIEIINKPLKAYYQIIKLRRQDISVTNQIDLQSLLLQTRNCFSKIFLLHKIQNSNLPLLKILKFQELLESLEQQIQVVLQANIGFNQLFALSSIKVSQLVSESKKINDLKQKIGEKLLDLVTNFPDSFFVSFFIFVFYQFLEVYRSKQKDLKIISQEKNLKKRLFQKQDEDIFTTDYGVIYIDMVQQRGKIKKITKNICQAYGHNYQDMVSYNINQFMPHLFSKYHHKFLINFIQFGKIKILADNRRLIFAKNKNKFIFPIIVRMKTQYLLNNQFGVTALIRKLSTSSEFILFGANGRIQEVTERIYKIIFHQNLKSQVDKTRRLCLIKMVPSLINLISNPNIEQNPDRIYESLFIFSHANDMLEKFRIYREPKQYDSSTNQPTNSYLSSSMQLEQTSNQMSMNGIGLGTTYYSEVFKSFLNQLNIIKLNAYGIKYKLSKIKTEQFSVFLLQIISIETIQNSYLATIDEYKKVAQSLSICEEYGSINENFEKYKAILQKNDVLNFMFSKNVEAEKANNKTSKKNGNMQDRGYKKRTIMILDETDNQNQAETIPESSLAQDFNDIANNMMNQQQLVQRGGSQRSSVSDQTQSQSKKQMLINAFNAQGCRISSKFLFFFNLLLISKLCILIIFTVNTIQNIDALEAEQLSQLTKIRMKQLFQNRLAIAEIKKYYAAIETRNFTVPAEQKFEINKIIDKLNREFTNTLVTIKKINQYNIPSKSDTMAQKIQIYDTYLKESSQFQILQLLNEFDYIFRNQVNLNGRDFLLINYEKIHNRLQQLCLSDSNKTSSQDATVDIILLMFGLYQMIVAIAVLIWIPIFYLVSKQQKRIINLLTTMNIKQLKRATHKLRLLVDNVRLEKIKQINYIMALISDEQIQNAVQLQKQKSITRNIRLVEEQGCYSIKPKLVSVLIFLLIIFFSLLPLFVYVNIVADKAKYQKTQKVIEQFAYLADKAPILVNIYLSNVNNLYNNETLKPFPPQIYQQASANYFNLTEIISLADQVTADLVDKNGKYSSFSGSLCNQIECLSTEKQNNLKFYDTSLLIRNNFNQLGPSKLDLVGKMNVKQVDKWSIEAASIQMMGFITKIYLFSDLWTKRFQSSISNILQNTKQRLIILVSIFIPIYVLVGIYIEFWLIKKMSKILKNAQGVHMHFPVQILAENTYLTSYFNEKIKNSK